MMKQLHRISISVFIKEEENHKEIEETLASILPDNFADQEIIIEQETVTIDQVTTMTIDRVHITKNKHCKEVLSTVKELLGEKQCKAIQKEDNRVDDKGFLYIRLDKKTLITSGEAKLVDHGDCFHIKILLAAYPKTKDNAIVVAKKLFS